MEALHPIDVIVLAGIAAPCGPPVDRDDEGRAKVAGHFYSFGRYRPHTADDDRAKRKRVEKRRKKKGYR